MTENKRLLDYNDILHIQTPDPEYIADFGFIDDYEKEVKWMLKAQDRATLKAVGEWLGKRGIPSIHTPWDVEITGLRKQDWINVCEALKEGRMP